MNTMCKDKNELDLSNPVFKKHGYIQVYTGQGKGKTTASLGLTLRALGHGWRVLIIQFMKAENLWKYGEISSLAKFTENLSVEQYGISIVGTITEDDKKVLKQGWEIAKDCIHSKAYDLIVLDEINHVINENIIELSDVISTLKNKPSELELVLTGRNAKPEILEIADLVTDMTCIKHYFDKNVMAREGVEW